jgi:hypothetical protein
MHQSWGTRSRRDPVRRWGIRDTRSAHTMMLSVSVTNDIQDQVSSNGTYGTETLMTCQVQFCRIFSRDLRRNRHCDTGGGCVASATEIPHHLEYKDAAGYLVLEKPIRVQSKDRCVAGSWLGLISAQYKGRANARLELVVGAVKSEMWEPTKPAPPDGDRNKFARSHDVCPSNCPFSNTSSHSSFKVGQHPLFFLPENGAEQCEVDASPLEASSGTPPPVLQFPDRHSKVSHTHSFDLRKCVLKVFRDFSHWLGISRTNRKNLGVLSAHLST